MESDLKDQYDGYFGRLVAERATDLSDAELDRVFGGAALPVHCIQTIQRLRDAEGLTVEKVYEYVVGDAELGQFSLALAKAGGITFPVDVAQRIHELSVPYAKLCEIGKETALAAHQASAKGAIQEKIREHVKIWKDAGEINGLKEIHLSDTGSVVLELAGEGRLTVPVSADELRALPGDFWREYAGPSVLVVRASVSESDFDPEDRLVVYEIPNGFRSEAEHMFGWLQHMRFTQDWCVMQNGAIGISIPAREVPRLRILQKENPARWGSSLAFEKKVEAAAGVIEEISRPRP